MATLALVVAVGGGGTAAWAMTHHRYVITSASQIKPGVLQQLRGHDGRNGTVGPAGPPGPVGPAGPTGSAGAPEVGGIVTATSGQQSLVGSPTVVSATAPSTGRFLVLGQVEGDDPVPQGDGALFYDIIDLTAAPGTDLYVSETTFPKETTSDALVDLVVQGSVTAVQGDRLSIKCTAFVSGAPNPSSGEGSIVLVPEP
ncbi:MAG TPA: hypothetical protein VGG41_12210 [Solirubrobacteraceae bacterium]